MCFEMLLPLLAGTAISAIGGGIDRNEATQNAQAIADARNKVLLDQTNKNNILGNEARTTFNGREGLIQPTAVRAEQAAVTGARGGAIDSNVPLINPANFPGAADSSTLVKASMADAIGKALGLAREKADAQAKLGGYGDLFQRMGLQDADASRHIQTDVNFAQANNALTPSLQDFAEHDAARPNSGLGGLLMGIGNAFGSYAGSHS